MKHKTFTFFSMASAANQELRKWSQMSSGKVLVFSPLVISKVYKTFPHKWQPGKCFEFFLGMLVCSLLAMMFERAYQILKGHDRQSCFEVQFAVYRNYNVMPDRICEHSGWETQPENLRQFMDSISQGLCHSTFAIFFRTVVWLQSHVSRNGTFFFRQNRFWGFWTRPLTLSSIHASAQFCFRGMHTLLLS